MTGWIQEALPEARRVEAERLTARVLLGSVVEGSPDRPDAFAFTQNVYELAVATLLDAGVDSSDLREAAYRAFETTRTVKTDRSEESKETQRLLTACYGVLADRTPDVARYLRSESYSDFTEASSWGERVYSSIVQLWLLLLRKQGWEDLDGVQREVINLRQQQQSSESDFLENVANPRCEAWRLIALYHLAKAAEVLGTYSSQGAVGGTFDVREQLQAQFDRAIVACERAELLDLHFLSRLLLATSEKLIANSIWSVTRAVNSRVSRFVEQLVSRDNANPIFEMLPPQRITLREQGLLGSGHRSVVVSLPTSSGKTFIAQFRMLQALNQFDHDRGWIAYVAPTRALVNQICSRLRRDFSPLGVVVERVSPALEIDGVEAELLADSDPDTAFRVLVGTPEKIDLLLRGGWEQKIGRPLTLVVVDEAHNIANQNRGLTLELLLATINRECRQSQFLLLTPFIDNGREVSRWLSPDSHMDMSIGFDWQPNDRAVMLSKPKRGDKRGEFQLALETLHTSHPSIKIEEELMLGEGKPLGLTWSKVNGSQSNVAAATAELLRKRGPVIVVAGTVPNSWNIAKTLANSQQDTISFASDDDKDISFVREFVANEYGPNFALVDLLSKRIGLHHSGLSDETRVLTEWLVEHGKLDALVATTTIAQGVNFPVSGVVMASHQYPYGQDMPPEDFWNLAGRAARADQVGTGIIALAAATPTKEDILRKYVKTQVSELNSTLFSMVQGVLESGRVLNLSQLYWRKEWSAFLQYLAHTYRQVGDHHSFASQVEQILRGSFGFQKLRRDSVSHANQLVAAVQEYASVLEGKPLSLVDATGFSWESVSLALANVGDAEITADAWRAETLFHPQDKILERAFGVLFKIPEIRQELIEVTGGKSGDGNKLARIVKAWVKGDSIASIAEEYFQRDGEEKDQAISRACRAVHGKLALSASWGISALQALTSSDALANMGDEEKREFQNLPSRIYYGVNSDDAIDLRLLGVPRSAAAPMASFLHRRGVDRGVRSRRKVLSELSEAEWKEAIGSSGGTYQRAWKVLEGME